jgi:copper chaperone CopZ
MEIIRLRVEGMACSGCTHAVETALQTVPGVIRVRADLEAGSAEVEAADTVTGQQLVAALEEAGYGARVVR